MQTISKHRTIHGAAQPHSGRSRSTKGTAPQRSGGKPAPDFLRHSFLPLYTDDGESHFDKIQTEQQYFESLTLLQTEYRLKPIDVSEKEYPYNLLLSSWDVERQMQRVAPDESFHIMDNRILIDGGKRMNTGNCLYYIPIQPLFMLTKAKGRQARKTAQLLLSVFAYLHDKVNIPSYTANDFIGWQYEMIEEWLEENGADEEPQDCFTRLNEIRAIHVYGKTIEKKLCHESHLLTFQQRIKSYKPCNNWEQELLNLAREIYDLWQCYPCSNLFSHIIPMEYEDEEEQVTRIEQYVSFVATGEGALFDELFQMVNERLGESVDMDEPAAYTIYGKAQNIYHETFDYEQKLFPLLGDLVYLLNNRP